MQSCSGEAQSDDFESKIQEIQEGIVKKANRTIRDLPVHERLSLAKDISGLNKKCQTLVAKRNSRYGYEKVLASTTLQDQSSLSNDTELGDSIATTDLPQQPNLRVTRTNIVISATHTPPRYRSHWKPLHYRVAVQQPTTPLSEPLHHSTSQKTKGQKRTANPKLYKGSTLRSPTKHSQQLPSYRHMVATANTTWYQHISEEYNDHDAFDVSYTPTYDDSSFTSSTTPYSVFHSVNQSPNQSTTDIAPMTSRTAVSENVPVTEHQRRQQQEEEETFTCEEDGGNVTQTGTAVCDFSPEKRHPIWKRTTSEPVMKRGNIEFPNFVAVSRLPKEERRNALLHYLHKETQASQRPCSKKNSKR